MKHLITGTAGIGIIQFISDIDPTQIQTILQILMQLAVGVATLWKLFKKKK